ncbi:MAG: hypothetical protein IJ673_13645 [Treponema sp.]|nr:hypothetical protein [Treponema sp.]
MAKDKTLLAAITNLTMNEALQIQIELAAAKDKVSPDSPGISRITNTKNLKHDPVIKAIKNGGKK